MDGMGNLLAHGMMECPHYLACTCVMPARPQSARESARAVSAGMCSKNSDSRHLWHACAAIRHAGMYSKNSDSRHVRQGQQQHGYMG
eukprot:1156168-Pelagomonas_calceolata.AAC.5